MEDIKKTILYAINQNPNKKVGINFLYNFLNDTSYEKVINGSKVTFPVIQLFRQNVYSCPQMLATASTWQLLIKSGDVSSAIVSAFDWDKSPEGFQYWFKLNEIFNDKLNEAKSRGLKMGDCISMSTNNPSLTDSTNSRIMPSDTTLNFIQYLSPYCTHTNKQIDILNNTLKELKCFDKFYANLRCKPKRDDYEAQFRGYMRGDDMRGVIFWAFNWTSTEEGWTYWQNVSNTVNVNITSVVVKRPSLIQKDPISHVVTTRPPLNPNAYNQGYGAYDDDEYDDYCDYWNAYRRSYFNGASTPSKPSIPKDIENMPLSNAHFQIISILTPSPSISEA